MKCWLLAISHPTSVSLALTLNPTPDLYVKETGAETSAYIRAALAAARKHSDSPPFVPPRAVKLSIPAVSGGSRSGKQLRDMSSLKQMAPFAGIWCCYPGLSNQGSEASAHTN